MSLAESAQGTKKPQCRKGGLKRVGPDRMNDTSTLKPTCLRRRLKKRNQTGKVETLKKKVAKRKVAADTLVNEIPSKNGKELLHVTNVDPDTKNNNAI
jgi:hypothetical protein